MLTIDCNYMSEFMIDVFKIDGAWSPEPRRVYQKGAARYTPAKRKIKTTKKQLGIYEDMLVYCTRLRAEKRKRRGCNFLFDKKGPNYYRHGPRCWFFIWHETAAGMGRGVLLLSA